jgi:lambda family phage portal protein
VSRRRAGQAPAKQEQTTEPKRRQRLAYDGASRKRIVEKWLPTGADADSEVGASSLMTYRARDMVRNDGRAAQAVRQIALHIVGTGIRPHTAIADDAATKRAIALWEEWGKVCCSGSGLSIYGHQLQMLAAMLESGEALVRRRPRRMADGLPVPLQLQPMESDFIDSLKTEILIGRTVDGIAYEAGEIVQGVEFDFIGWLVAYWLFSRHPGNVYGAGAQTSQRVSADDVIHLYPEPFARIGQTRGVSWLAPVLIRLRQLADYELTEGVRKKIAATQAIVVTGRERSVDADATDADTLSGEVLTDSDGARVETIRPGMIAYAAEESDVKLITPPVDQSYPAHLEVELHQIAAGLGLPYELLTGDLSKVNYSSIRYGMLAFRRLCTTIRDLIVVPLLCQREWQWFTDAAIAAGALPDRAYPVVWRAPAWEEVDRRKEADADVAEIRGGLTTLHDVLARRGEEYDATMDTIEAERADLASRGIILDSLPQPPAPNASSASEPDADDA